MTLQPIIENAVKYGLEPLNRPGLLRVFTQESNGVLNIVIEDNGVGMDDQLLRQLLQLLDEEDSGDPSSNTARRGIGLQNVHRRIRLMFGNGYGLRIESSRERGTTVVVAMPLPAPGGHQL
ncbi:sensor histidine kinase [Cohnella kolymensis]|uniref:sensor histidine kinase n=1 Tax=Cohnella kolymensis TaxID=1590652 RepID=UPI000AD19B31